MRRDQLKLAPGGLMRCCTQSLDEWIKQSPEAEVYAGEKIACKYENKDTMEVDEIGVVRWVKSQFHWAGIKP